MNADDLKFSRRERLKSLKTISKLFVTGNVLYHFPLKLVWSSCADEQESNKFAVSVPKRKFKTAVSRNILKRRIREAYRLHKSEIKSQTNSENLNLMFIFLGKESLSFSIIENTMICLISKLNSEIESNLELEI